MEPELRNQIEYVPFELNLDRIKNVAIALANRDISECKIQDVDHVSRLLTHLVAIEQASPGFVNELCSFAPLFAEVYRKRQLEDKYQSRFEKLGLGEDFRELVEAGNSPHQKDFMPKMVGLQMKMTGVNQSKAIKELVRQSGRKDKENYEDSLRRTVSRSKARKK